MKLVFKLHTMRPEYLESVKKFLLHLPTFTEIFVYYKNCVHDNAGLKAIIGFPMQHETPGSTEKFIKFRLSHRLLLSAGFLKLTLSNDLSAKVLGNPLIMKRVIRSLGFWNVQHLRKTSRGIRSCVDFLKPVTHIHEYNVYFSSDIHPSACIRSGGCYSTRSWLYGKHETSEDRNLLCQKAQDQVLNDFEVNLGRQNACLEKLKFIFSYIDTLQKEEPSIEKFECVNQLTIQFLEKLKEILSARSQLLKVKVLELLCCTDDNLMKILPYLDPKCLKKIEINDPRSEYGRLGDDRVKYPESMLKPFVLDEICQLEQWKSATELKIRSQPISTSIQKMNITHFSRIWIEVDTISSEDVLYLKDHLLLSTSFQRFIIDFKNTTIDYETLHGLIGPPQRIFSDTSRIWFFQMENMSQNYPRMSSSPITSIGVLYTEKSLKCELYFNDPYGKQSFEYKETRKRNDFLKNFVEDLEEIINNQKSLVESLKIKYSGLKENYTKNKLDPVIHQIFKCLESRKDLLQVKRLLIDAVDMSQAMRVVKLLDPSVLKKVEFCFENRDEDIDMEDALALVKWNEGKRMKLVFKLHTIRPEYLELMKKFFLHRTTFTEIFIYYKHCVHDYVSSRSIFGFPMQYETPGSTEKFIKFRLSHRRLLSARLVKLTLSNDLSAKVLGNPLIMKRVIRSLGFWNVQHLRKTSRGIRSCVDFLKPVTHIDEYNVYFSSDIHPSACIRSGGCYSSRSWLYGKHETSEDRNLLCQKAQAQVLNDFEVNLRNQNTCLEELKFIFSYIDTLQKEEPSIEKFERVNQLTIQFLEKLKEILSARSHLLKVKVLELLCCTDNNLMQILPYLDPNCLKKIEVNDPRWEYERLGDRVKYPESMLKPFVLDEICQLEQWKSATELEIRSEPISTSIQKMNITHFSRIWIEVDTISSEDVLYLKGHLLLSTTFQRFIIHFKNTTIDYETLHGLIGPPHRIFSDTSRIWFFQMEVNHQFLKVSLKRRCLDFDLADYIRQYR
ncbi:hypothetical protein GCK72_011664 [Caenorhabditis remanei]|uniref:DUF38 domain-containing protein n=1 Tax=Caenorhabditis remanei TaxID=31234 RepID=A0A6A5H6N2_CAERE|nr:hypothetical protein GCK72_011664 [Caenorhabditis remanei]KAF1763398.1 hypothetical protein GCK72_011664 [Caenorhabditis remanei]